MRSWLSLLVLAGCLCPSVALAQESSRPEQPVEAQPVEAQPVESQAGEAQTGQDQSTEASTAAQEGAAQEGAQGQPGEQPGDFMLAEPTPSDLELIDRLLEEDEQALQGGQVYDPENRRDPFQSLLVNVAVEERSGPRPDGIPGLLIDQLTLIGVWEVGGVPVVQVQPADDPKQYLLHEGDRLYDGEVVSIQFTRGEGSEVVFRQRVNDPNAPKPFREIVKRLEP